jgi:hypothetical protein
MSVTNTVAKLQAKHRQIVGVKTAPTDYPTKVNNSDLPLCIVTAGPGTCNTLTIGSLKEKRREYSVKVLALAVGQDKDDAGIKLVHTLLDAFATLYADAAWYVLDNAPQTYILNGGGEDSPHDSGYVQIDRGAVPGQGPFFHGFEFTVPVVEVE